MKILCVGDVCGSIGCEMLAHHLSRIKREYAVDFTIVNGENSADGNGIVPASAEFLINIGADVITGGNHSFRREEIFAYYDSHPYVLRPHNLRVADYGGGYYLADLGKIKIAVINLSGKVYLERQEADNPFAVADELLIKAREDGANIILVDFHAEATSEKRALGFYLDGKVSAVFGTHTHVRTADLQVLPNGTGYITDLGMTGPKNSVLGVKSEIIINRLKSNDMSRFELASGPSMINGCVFDIDEKTGKTQKVIPIYCE